MYKITAICDRCKKEETQEREIDCFCEGGIWRTITLEMSQYCKKKYLLCYDCQVALNITNPNALKSGEERNTVADKLMECISEIVAEQIQR